MTKERLYTEKEVEILLRLQRENCSFALSLCSAALVYPADFDKIKIIIEESPVINYEHNLKYMADLKGK